MIGRGRRAPAGTNIEWAPSVIHICNAVAALTLLFAACHDTPLPRTAVPNFVAPERATSMQSADMQMPLGETLTWRISVRGMLFGIAELKVRGQEDNKTVESRFQTTGLANQIRPVLHQLVTSLVPVASKSLDVHKALGRVRAWAQADASPATLMVRYQDTTYLLKLAQPRIDNSLSTPTWRIEAELGKREQHIRMTLWLTLDALRVPVQMTLVQDGQLVRALLVDAGES